MILKLLSKDEIIRKYLELEKDRERLKADFEKIKREKEALEKELRKYKNPNTPPILDSTPSTDSTASTEKHILYRPL
ncbi:hypothetical protein COT48_04010 [Candidatus Woesearchaeota archaeon CG08_land_8_20_14_0_20_47_9]|nr:MAG: hypothetical protein AUJ69_02470 [Candidatus Woesearchaeota archaeon CG1_02_47_18]PIN72460.1 MAG: hypothetical protein COV22_03130 [Candidatus Woesearchaeota archaeon CG10_big_fil_rev_8_21_14_0_10_47_5]PIO03654.1 MAG: hypothetical protein COT48_04010 [Candidatus Woesearchaeota archaeon CG08_land_8_20_14_0_20_47_9]